MEALKLFPYQEIGVEWLKQKPFRLLADSMGIGKSAQTIRAADSLELRKILIICPSIARLTWQREIAKWSLLPNRKVRILKKRNEVPNADDEILICSFDYATSNFNLLRNRANCVLIVDEAHYLKSVQAKRTKAIMSGLGIVHSCKRVWFLTGTPMPNHPYELFPMLKTFGITKFNSDQFIKEFCHWYEFNGSKVISGARRENLPKLKEMLDTVMLRRRTKDVLKDLPSVMISDLPIEADLDALTPDLKAQFTAVQEFFKDLNISDPLAQLKILEGLASSVSSLRRYCVMQKVKPVCELIEEELQNNAYTKIIIFGHHKEALTGVCTRLNTYNPVLINGDVPADLRQQYIDEFQNDPLCRVIVGNISAAGTNITLTAASQVLFLEQAWVPGDNAQAVARAARIGQTQTVNVRIASLAGTIDESVQEILTRKMKDILQLLG